jgi:hypothetical protein
MLPLESRQHLLPQNILKVSVRSFSGITNRMIVGVEDAIFFFLSGTLIAHAIIVKE